MIIVNVVDIDGRETTDGGSDSLIPGRIKNGGTQVVHASRIRIGLRLSAEYGAIEDDIGDIVQNVGFNFDQIGLAENDDFNRIRRFASRVSGHPMIS